MASVPKEEESASTQTVDEVSSSPPLEDKDSQEGGTAGQRFQDLHRQFMQRAESAAAARNIGKGFHELTSVPEFQDSASIVRAHACLRAQILLQIEHVEEQLDNLESEIDRVAEAQSGNMAQTCEAEVVRRLQTEV